MVYIPYGAFVTGPDILSGKYRGLDYQNEEKYPLLPLFSKHGLSGIGWNYALHNMLDTNQQAAHKPGKSISFPNLKTAGQRWGDYALSLGGISTALFDHMIADKIYLGATTLFNKYKKQGYTDEDAARIAVKVMNHGSFMFHRSIYSSEGMWEDILLMSRQFFTTGLRTAVFLGEQAPVGAFTGMAVGGSLAGPVGAAVGGASGWLLSPKLRKFASTMKTGPISKMSNSITGGELTLLDHKVMSKEISYIVMSVGFWSMLTMAVLQYVLSFDDDDPEKHGLDEHGEDGSKLGNKAKKRWMIFNQDPLAARLPAQDYNSRQMMIRPQFGKMFNDVVDVYGGAIDAAYNYGKEPEDRIELGKGIWEWMHNKQGVIKFFEEELANSDGFTKDEIYNREKGRFEDENLEVFFKRVAFELLGPIGTEEMVGSEDMDDTTIRALEIGGYNIKRGSPYGKGSTAKEYKDLSSRIHTQAFKDKARREPNRNLSPEDLKRQRQKQGRIDRESIRQLQKKRRNPLRDLKRSNRKSLKTSKKETAAEEAKRKKDDESRGALIKFFMGTLGK